MTIDAYASRLNNQDNKDKLIMEAVLSVYKTPIEEKQSTKLEPKTALDTMKAMVDATKDLAKGVKVVK